MGSNISLYYLCLQATRQGQASYSHVHEIILGLQSRGVEARLFEPRHEKSACKTNFFARLLGFVNTQCKLIFSNTPEVIYIRWHFATIFVALWAKLRNVPVIQEVNGPYEDLFLSYSWTKKIQGFFIFIMRQQLKWADAVIVVTPLLAEWAIKESKHRKVYIISNGANTSIFDHKASFLGEFCLPDRYVIFFGALSVWQGVDVMLDAFRSNQWPKDIALVIVGDGVESQKVNEAACSSRFLYHFESVEQRVLAGIVRNSLCALSPQVGHRCSTGLFPLKLFESLACGVPVIVSDWPGMADFVREHQCGIVVPPGDPEALAQAVAQLASDPDRAREMGKRGAEEVHRKHSWDAKAEETLQVIYSIISDKDRA
jgi:glycosyltransferase involved in cell wall biosynthesis